MFCQKCGAAVAENSLFCNQCGQSVAPAPGQQTPAPFPSTATAEVGETSGKALASLVTGIFGLLIFPIAIAAIILGHMSRSEIRRSNGRLKGDGMATAGLVMGYGAFAVIPFILIIAAIAIPNLLRARIAANESSAVSAVRSLNSAESSYQNEYPNIGFTCSLETLGGSSTSTPSADHAQIIDDRLGAGEKNGYRFELRNCVNSEADGSKYQVVAYPKVRNQTGMRAFCSDESGVIKVDPSGSADDCLNSGAPLSTSRD
jgi:type II secretory pathway pseudopilin PulG